MQKFYSEMHERRMGRDTDIWIDPRNAHHLILVKGQLPRSTSMAGIFGTSQQASRSMRETQWELTL